MSCSKISPLNVEELCAMRYWYVATVIGKKVMVMVLLAYIKGKTTINFKEDLLQYYALKSYKKDPETLYKNDFNVDERSKLEDPSCRPESLDVTLIDKLLRRLRQLTGLAFHYDKLWSETQTSNPSIEQLIYKVKSNRNDSCHLAQNLSESELANKFKEMKDLFVKLVECVSTKYGEAKEILCDRIDQIDEYFDDLSTDIDKYKKEKKDFLLQLDNETSESCQNQLKQIYEETYKTNLLEWLNIPKMDREEFFTEMVIVKEEKDSSKVGSTNDKQHDFTDIFTIKNVNQEIPRILTITAVGGHGKSTSTRLLVCKWGKMKLCIPKLNEFNILLFVELRSEAMTTKSFDDLIRYRLGAVMTDVGLSFGMLKQIILRLKVLFILDGQDESPDNDLLLDIISLTSIQSNMKVIVTTRPSAARDLQTIVNKSGVPKLDLMLTGISKDNQVTFIKRLVMVMITDVDTQTEIMKSVETQLSQLNNNMGEIMQSPLILTLLTVLWVVGKMTDSMTTTDIFIKVIKELKEKLFSRLLLRGILISESLKAKLEDFERYLEKIGHLTFSRMEFNLNDSTMNDISSKLNQLKLSDIKEEILGHYLAPIKCRENFDIVIKYTFKHARLQEFYASKHFCYLLDTANDEEKMRILKQLDDNRFANIRSHIMAFLTDSHPQLLKKYGKAIIDCEQDDDNVDGYLKLTFESKANKSVIEMVSTNMAQMRLWQVNSPSGLVTLMNLLQNSLPKWLFLCFPEQMQPPPILASCLQTITNYKLDLVLDLPSIPDNSRVSTIHDGYISTLTKSSVLSNLVSFSGCLTQSALQYLPASLTVLNVALVVDDLPVLFQRLPYLTELFWLEIRMKCSQLEDVASLVQLQVTKPIAYTNVDLHGATDGDCDFIAMCMRRCYTGGKLDMKLYDANISGDMGIRLLQDISDHQVKCSEIFISSAQSLSECHQEELKNLVKICCNGIFKWSSKGFKMILGEEKEINEVDEETKEEEDKEIVEGKEEEVEEEKISGRDCCRIV